MHSTLSWLSSFIATLLVVSAVSACGASKPVNTSPQAGLASPSGSADGAGEDEDDSTADLAEHHRHHHHGGFAMFIAMSLDTIGAAPEQQQSIDQIQADMFERLKPAHDAEQAVLEVLAEGVSAGKIDQPAVDQAIARVSGAAAEAQGAIADSLNKLHAVLTPEQRTALADKVEAQFEVWHHVNADTPKVRVEHLAHDLDLSPSEADKIRTDYEAELKGMPPFVRDDAEQYIKAFGAGFAADTFDAASLGSLSSVNARLATWGLTRLARLYEAALPSLTTAQAAKLADIIRAHANYKRTTAEGDPR